MVVGSGEELLKAVGEDGMVTAENFKQNYLFIH